MGVELSQTFNKHKNRFEFIEYKQINEEINHSFKYCWPDRFDVY